MRRICLPSDRAVVLHIHYILERLASQNIGNHVDSGMVVAGTAHSAGGRHSTGGHHSADGPHVSPPDNAKSSDKKLLLNRPVEKLKPCLSPGFSKHSLEPLKSQKTREKLKLFITRICVNN